MTRTAPNRTAPNSSIAPCQEELGPKALETPIECEHCHAKVPATVVFTFEGADYVHYFCGPRCISAWCSMVGARENIAGPLPAGGRK